MQLSLLGSVGLFLLAGTAQEHRGHQTLEIRAGAEPFTTVHYGDGVRVPYLWPVRGPGGVEMTRAYPMQAGRAGEAKDHPHHTSLWFAHGDVNGHDFWHATGAVPRIVVDGEPVVQRGGETTSVVVNHEWQASEGEALLGERRTMIFREADAVRTIDFDITLGARVDVTFGDTKEGTFAMRLHPALRLRGDVAVGHARDSEGREDGDLWGERSRWLTYWGQVGERTVGVAIFDHPANLRHPTWWHARDYGLVGANPFGIHDFDDRPEGSGDFELARGETLRLRYRVVLYEGAGDPEQLEASWQDWQRSSRQGESDAGESDEDDSGEGDPDDGDAGRTDSSGTVGSGNGEPTRSIGRDS